MANYQKQLESLHQYIQASQKEGYLASDILKKLKSAGWTNDLLEDAFDSIVRNQDTYRSILVPTLPTSIIEIQNITKEYINGEAKTLAISNISLTIKKGDFVAIMGQSGSGKSTLMHILGLLDTPTFGSYRLGGEETANLNSSIQAEMRSCKVGFVFQQFNLLPRTSVLDNVLLPTVYARGSDDVERAKQLIDRVGLSSRIHHKSNQISGGQIQRVAIARALMMNPAIILADEPTGNLDSKTSEEILELFKEINNSGTTIIIVTHEEEIARHAKRIIRLKDGSVISDEQVK